VMLISLATKLIEKHTPFEQSLTAAPDS